MLLCACRTDSLGVRQPESCFYSEYIDLSLGASSKMCCRDNSRSASTLSQCFQMEKQVSSCCPKILRSIHAADSHQHILLEPMFIFPIIARSRTACETLLQYTGLLELLQRGPFRNWLHAWKPCAIVGRAKEIRKIVNDCGNERMAGSMESHLWNPLWSIGEKNHSFALRRQPSTLLTLNKEWLKWDGRVVASSVLRHFIDDSP